jgi:hypothetical protein
VFCLRQNDLCLKHAVAAQYVRETVEAFVHPQAVFLRNWEFWLETEHEEKNYRSILWIIDCSQQSVDGNRRNMQILPPEPLWTTHAGSRIKLGFF